MAKGKHLVIVESPAKAKTINKYLGNEYIVKSSIGHIRDLPMSDKKNGKKGKGKDATEPKRQGIMARIGLDPDNNWKANYQVLPDKRDVVAELRKLAAVADKVYLATDLDREGEAIAWHLKEIIGGPEDKFYRVVFNEITKNAIQEAFSKPGKLNYNQVHAQQVRRYIDRIVGFTVSPLLWERVARGLSAGRVQSVATKVVVEREREIKAFIPDEYWNIFANTMAGKDELRLELTKVNGQTAKITNEIHAKELVALLSNSKFVVKSQEEKPTQHKPSAPFITSTLQQAASTKLGYPVKKTMKAAQKLYEAGYITYMRTDSTFLSADAISAVRAHIKNAYGEKYLPAYPNKYGNKANAQEAHEAIRPSNVNTLPGSVSNVENDAVRLYKLIWEQFVSCQMVPADFLSTTVLVEASQCELKAKGRVLVFDGFTKVRSIKSDDEDAILPKVKVGDTLLLKYLDPVQKYTKPPARYSEASLVKELESKGIGRPSTYATIISTIQDRGYVTIDSKRIHAEKTGEIVTDKLNESFHELMDYQFTAHLENTLDEIAEGKQDYLQFLNKWWGDFSGQLERAKSEGGMSKILPMALEEIHCKVCSRNMAIRSGMTGLFLGCTGYSLPKDEKCKSTQNLLPVESAVSKNNEDEELSKLLNKCRCDKCQSVMDDYIIDRNTKISICSNFPECSGHKVVEGEFKLPTVSGGGEPIECDKCKGLMGHIVGRFGPYYKCTSDACGNTRRINKDGSVAPPKAFSLPMEKLKVKGKNDHFILRVSGDSIFLAASKFPKVRETRAISITELKSVGDKIPDNFKFYLTAPEKVNDLPTFAMYDRFKKEPIVCAMLDTTRVVTLHYKDNKWVE